MGPFPSGAKPEAGVFRPSCVRRVSATNQSALEELRIHSHLTLAALIPLALATARFPSLYLGRTLNLRILPRRTPRRRTVSLMVCPHLLHFRGLWSLRQ